MKLRDRIKFEQPETGEIWEGQISWNTGEVQILHIWREVEGKTIWPLIVEVARLSDDGIFRRVTEYKFDKQAEDILRTLRKSTVNFNVINESRNSTPKS